jgi:spermidine/putrescine transport system permease protein
MASSAHRSGLSLGDRLLRIYAGLVYLFLFAPIIVVVISSFNPSGRWNVPHGFTMRWYADLMKDDEILHALRTSLTIAVLVAIISSLLGLLAAYGLSRTRFPGRGLVQALFYLPMLVPGVVCGIALIIWFNKLGIATGFLTILIAHVLVTLPFTLTLIMTSFYGFDRRLEEAAHDLGANDWNTFWKVTFPLVLPGVIGGALIAFTLSFDEFVLTFFVAGGGVKTLPLVIYSRIRYLLSPVINAIATVVIVFSIALLLLSQVAQVIRARKAEAA